MIILIKKIGQTPLELLEDYKNTLQENELYEITPKKNKKKIKFAYAGRLDPMARGKMIILRGLECKEQDLYCNLDKEYEFEVLFNFTTDTYDIMGFLQNNTNLDYTKINQFIKSDLKKYVKKIKQEYPPYSSFSINGNPLWKLSKQNIKPNIPKKDIEIYNLNYLGHTKYSHNELFEQILKKINSLNKTNFENFRVIEILNKWKNYFETNYNKEYIIYKFKSKVSSGTYIRSLIYRMGQDLETGAIAFDINRTNFYEKNIC